jgi:2-polyprenyl-6-methoxyphenol hydroxylase-like FAD-dependent oxidoreductase
LTLAIALGRRGIDCVIAETKDQPAHLPKMERCNARTMEHFRRLATADRVRAAGLPSHVPMDVYVTTSIAAEPILHLPYPSHDEARKLAAQCNDASMPLESQQLVSQYSLEPVLRGVAESLPSVTVRYSCEVTSLEQDDTGVTAVLSTAGEIDVLRAHYLVGCDGGASPVRRALGCKLEGQGDIARLRQVFFRSNELIERISRASQARHFYIADEDPRMIGTAIVVQSDQRHFTLHTSLPEDTDFVPVIQRAVGIPVDVEVCATTSNDASKPRPAAPSNRPAPADRVEDSPAEAADALSSTSEGHNLMTHHSSPGCVATDHRPGSRRHSARLRYCRRRTGPRL